MAVLMSFRKENSCLKANLSVMLCRLVSVLMSLLLQGLHSMQIICHGSYNLMAIGMCTLHIVFVTVLLLLLLTKVRVLMHIMFVLFVYCLLAFVYYASIKWQLQYILNSCCHIYMM